MKKGSVLQLLITCEKFLDSAKRILASKSGNEEDLRTAISRAYYSLYHQTLLTTKNRYSLDLIDTIEKRKKRRLSRREETQLSSLDSNFLRSINLHRILPLTLAKIGESTKSVLLKNYRVLRNQADYDLKLNFNESDVTTYVTAIETLFNEVKVL